ncbi:hypothetical protein [Paenibacillus silvae]|uniref:NodB homology domain-containing protein n=1 Tax=Paenibacillus silvae TaxID=1325358 RepID=A0A2W6NNF0_9BACL|nr:hypothetical protein [Paenibacillus silvae]PZT57357.1 hypothetical protein DN757_01495 [Paenibacillus silvae]
MNIQEAKETIAEMGKALHELQIISWNEVFENLPDKELIEDDVYDNLLKLEEGIKDLSEFFE